MLSKKADLLRVQAATKEIQEVLTKHFGEQNKDFLFEEALGNVIAQYNYDKDGIANGNLANWTMDAYLARSLDPHIPRIARLVQWLVEQGATPEKPFDAEHAGRYAAVLFDGETNVHGMAIPTRIVAFKTQSLTYMLKLTEHNVFQDLDDGSMEMSRAWGMSLRFCTKGRYSLDYCRPEFKSLTPEYLKPYFECEDARDQGFLLEAKPPLRPVLAVKDASCVSLEFLGGFLFDLHCHASLVPREHDASENAQETQEQLDSASDAVDAQAPVA